MVSCSPLGIVHGIVHVHVALCSRCRVWLVDGRGLAEMLRQMLHKFLDGLEHGVVVYVCLCLAPGQPCQCPRALPFRLHMNQDQPTSILNRSRSRPPPPAPCSLLPAPSPCPSLAASHAASPSPSPFPTRLERWRLLRWHAWRFQHVLSLAPCRRHESVGACNSKAKCIIIYHNHPAINSVKRACTPPACMH